jgi:tRNA(His) guanylyltransferase
MSKLKDRIASYRDVSDYKLLNKLPIVLVVNGRAFSKNTALLDKPYDERLSECMLSTALKLCSEIDGAVFAYQYSDEIVIAIRNDQNSDTNSWYNGRVQKISSITASIATSHFTKCADKIKLNITADPTFTSEAFALPNMVELSNAMIFKQQQNYYSSIQNACFYELLNQYDKNAIKDMLSGLSVDEKIDLLHQECKIDFNNYPVVFRRGAAVYKTSKLDVSKSKWNINLDLPIFTKDTNFLKNIFLI